MWDCTEEQFGQQKKAYLEVNRSFSKTLVFHVGIEAGLYSELGGMFEAMLYAYMRQIRFVLYADDANFCGPKGWREFFEPFCEESHNRLHHYLNRRRPIRRYPKLGKICQSIFKKIWHIDYLTSDVFQNVISNTFKQEKVGWELFGIHGTVYPEIAKLYPFGMRYNAATKQEIEKLIEQLKLPEHYISMQIRGGDKSREYQKLYDAEECMKKAEEYGVKIQNLFVFTDDYRNVEYIQKNYQDVQVYTLTRPEEHGYVNADFQKQSWEERRKDIVKLFAIVAICCDSDLHFGCEQASVNNIIKAAKPSENYLPLMSKFENIRIR